jgi:hypothetical protein
MDEKDGFGFDRDSKLNELFKLLEQAMREQDDRDEDFINSYFNQFENNIDHTFIPFDEINEREPDEIEKYTEDNLTFEIKYWYLPEGGHYKSVEITGDETINSPQELEEQISKIVHSNMGANRMSVDVNRKEGKSLQERLDEAVKKEDYMLAARLRDEIRAEKKAEEDRLLAQKGAMEAKIIEINLALEEGDIDKSERLLDELRNIKKYL